MTCGTAPNQFTIQIVSDSSYNGYELLCADGCTGYYTVNVTGGIGPFSFQWLGNGNTGAKNNQSWTQVCDQNAIQVLVTDNGQSTTCAASHVLNVPTRLQTINFTLTPPSCYNSCDGTATHSPVFGVPAYSFSWTNGETTQNASALCIGSTTLTITDQNGCQFDTTVTITTPPPIFANVSVTEVSCNNACDGVLSSSPSGGTGGPFSYTWTNVGSGTNIGNTNTASNLCENLTYNLHLVDNTNCFIDTAITLQDKIPMTIAVASTVDAQCFNVCNGQMTLNVSGGTAPYVSYTWYQGTFGNGVLQSFSGATVNQLCANTDYYVVVTDSDGCSDSLQINQLGSPPTIIIAETHLDNNCFGANAGTIDITPSGGAGGTYTYLWTTADGSGLVPTSEDQSGLSGGTYNVVVTDTDGCQETASITIAEPTEINANGTATDITCFNLTDGAITLSTTGGAGGYSWTWTSTDGNFVNPSTESLTNLDSATYTVHIVDSDGCFKDTSLHISKPEEIFVNGVVTPILCNGDNNAQINITPVNGTGVYTFDWDTDGTGDFDDTQNLTNLSPNTYNLSIRDGNNCQKDTAITISEPLPISITSSETKPHCGQTDGSITASASGGTAGYSYSWTDASNTNVGNTATASNLTAGCYDVLVTDANNCTQTLQVCITDETPPTVTFTPSDASCNGICDGSITIAISDGTAPFTTTWTSTDAGFTDPGTDDIYNLCAADYNFSLTDANNCPFTQTITIAEPLPINITDVITPINCNGGSDGAIDITVSGGTVGGAYQYNWTGTGGYTNNIEDISSLSLGTYNVVVTDDNNCSNNGNFIINEPIPITILTNSTNAQCNQNTGSITATVSGGTPNYSYIWTNASNVVVGGNSTILSNQPSGVYTLAVTDGNGCIQTGSATISDDNGPTLTVDNSGDVSCNGFNDGFINITASGGVGALSYSWTSTPLGYTSTAEDINLLAGNTTYNVTVSDANGCTANQSVVINEPLPINLTSTNQNPLCNGGNSGAIDLFVSGGTPNYTYDWNTDGTGDYDDTEDLTNLGAGTYIIAVLDNNNCTQSATITLNEPTAMTITPSSVNSNCTQSDGSATVVVSNGTPIPPNNYNYQWSPTGNTIPVLGNLATLSNQPAGCYDVSVSDANNCIQIATVCITDDAAPNLSINATDLSCFGGNDGTITLGISGGQTPYAPITWTGNTSITNGNLNPTNLTSGVYSVQVTDGAGCIATISDTVKEPLQISITAIPSNPTCNGGNDGSINATVNNTVGVITYSWTGPNGFVNPGTEDLNGLIAGTYCLTVTDGNGCTLTQCFILNDPSSIIVTSSNNPTSCANPTGQLFSSATGGTPNYSYNWINSSNISVGNNANEINLPADTYTLTVTDNNGCTASSTETISMANAPVVSLINSSDVLCNGGSTGSIVINVTGGTIPYQYDWDNLVGTNDPQNQNGLSANTYTVIVTDASGCSDNLAVVINEPNLPLTASATPTNALCNSENSGSIDLVVSGGTPNYNFLWSNNNTSEDLSGIGAGTYSVIITDNNGCQFSTNATVTSPSALALTTTGNTATCGISNGNASVSVSGGTPVYNYNWTDVTNSQPGTAIGGNSTLLNTIPAGSYQVLVTDNNGCKDSSIVSISNTTGPTVSYITTDVLCYGAATGAIDLTATGVPTLSYTWTGPLPFTGATTEDIQNVEAGVYTVAVLDGNNCSTNQTITINGPTAPISDNAIITNLTCYNDGSGQIDLSISGGTSPYTTNWTGPNGYISNSEDINSLFGGTYNLHIDDANGCGYDNILTVLEPDSIIINPTVNNPSCGVTDGTISVSPSGGTVANNYIYSWTNMTSGNSLGSVNNVSGLGAGLYNILVTDDNGCSNSLVIPLTDDNAPSLSVVNTNIDCFGNATGAINLTVGGNNNYQYDWDNDGLGDNDDTEDLTGLTAGAYSVIVTDLTTGCIASLSTTITTPDLLSISDNSSNLACFNDNSGTIDITVTGGTNPYTYNWDNLVGINNPEDQTGLAAGTYSVTVIDANGCTIAAIYTLTEPLSIQTPSILTHNNCFGETQGAIDLTPINGTPSYTYSWTGNLPFTGSTSEDLTNLTAGNYSVTVTDAEGCSKDTAITITTPTDLNFNLSISNAACSVNDGSVSVLVSGGTLTSPDYTYNWTSGGTSVSNTNTITNVVAGAYLLTVTDDNGCTKDSLINIDNIDAPVITFDSLHHPLCNDDNNGDIFVSVTGGITPYLYVWNPNAISQTEDLLNVSSGNYILTVTDANGCISTFDTTLINPTPIAISTTVNDATCGDCNGGATVTATGGVGNLTYIWSNNLTTPTINNMCAGIYPVQITDVNGCSETSTVIINNTGGPTGENTLINNVACYGGNNGSIWLSAIGGTAPYTYFWPHNLSTSNSISNLTAGTYLVQITDANGCMRTSSFTITEPTPIVATTNMIPATCLNNDGEILLSISGGVSPVSILWANGLGTSPSINSLSNGTYDVTLTDANGCMANYSFYLPNTAAPNLTLTSTDVLCNGDLTGNISTAVTGNVGTISYQWSNANGIILGETSSILSNIGAGTYAVTITDNTTSCVTQSSVTIAEPLPLELGLPHLTTASCNSVCDASALVNPIGGTLAYSYTWNNGETTQQANTLCVGINTITITDNNNCSIEQTITTTANNQLTATITNIDATCGDCNGESNLVPGGGSGSYTILWADGSNSLSHTNLCAGVHPFEVIDANGCSMQLQTVISNTGGPDNETINQSNVTCNGGNDGSIIVSPSGGTLPYSYFWIPTGATTNSINNLTAGDYYLEVTDSNKCTRVVPVTITEPELPIINSVIINSNCGNNDGEIIVTVNGINAPYAILWNGSNGFSSTNSSIQNLAPGSYQLSLTDVNGCVSIKDFVINTTQAPLLTISKTDISCFGLCNGTAEVTALPTAGTYSYDWLTTNVTTTNITNLCTGIHFVEVTNTSTGCKAIQQVEIEQPDSIVVEIPFIQNPTCFSLCDGIATAVATGGTLNYTYNWQVGSTTASQNNLCVGDSKLIITDAHGCKDSLLFTISEPTEIIITIDDTTSSECKNSTEGEILTTVTGGTPNYTFNWVTMPSSSFNATTEDIQGLLPTNYILTVTDNNGCIKTDTIAIDTNHIVVADAGLDTSICVGSCAILIGQGEGPSGIMYEWFNEYGASVSNNDTFQICFDTTKICPFVLVVSDNFCSDSDTANVVVLDLPFVDAGGDAVGLSGSVITLGGSPTSFGADSYIWSPITNLLPGEEVLSNPQIELNDEEDLVVFVTDVNGCVNSDTIHVKPLPEINFPNGFTPNEDGINDYWRIDFIKEFPQSVVEVYNRWGQLLFRSIGYTEPWNGIYKGKQLPVGTYYYIIELNDPNFPDGYTGPVTIMR